MLASFLVILPVWNRLMFPAGLHKTQRDGGLSRWG